MTTSAISQETHEKMPYLPDGSEAMPVIPSTDLISAAPILSEGITYIQETDMEYYGYYGDVNNILTRSLQTRKCLDTVLAIGRVTRALIDRKIDVPEDGISFDTIVAATDLTLAILSGRAGNPEVVDFYNKQPEAKLPIMSPVKQQYDGMTLLSTTDAHITKAASALAEVAKEDDILFLTLCHGGLLAGVGTFLTREQTRPYSNSVLYPVRFSRYKHSDKMPRLTTEEQSRLKEEAEGKRVIIFDEDTCSGKTLLGAEQYFSMLFGCTVACVTTKDATREYEIFQASRPNFTNFEELHGEFIEHMIFGDKPTI